MRERGRGRESEMIHKHGFKKIGKKKIKNIFFSVNCKIFECTMDERTRRRIQVPIWPNHRVQFNAFNSNL